MNPFFYQKIKKLIFGSTLEIKLEKKIFLLLMLNTIFISFIAVINYSIIIPNFSLSFLTLIAFITVTWAYFFSKKGDNYEKITIPLFIFSLLFLTAHWILNAGYKGNTLTLFFIYFMGIYVIVKPKLKTYVFISYLLVFISVFLFQYFFDGYISYYNNDIQQYKDVFLSNVVYFIFLFIMLYVIISSYRSENLKTKIINNELIKKQSDIEHWTNLVTESEEKFRRIADQVPDVIFLTDEHGNITYLSEATKNIFGSEPSDMIGNPFTDYLHESCINNAIEQFTKTLQQKIITKELPLKIKRKDGNILDIELNASVFYENKNVVGAIGIMRDISDRIIIQEEITVLSKVVEQSPASILITDVNGNIEYVNNKFCEVTGYEPHELYGQNPRIMKSGYQDKEFYAKLWDTVLSGKEWRGELFNKKKNGEGYWEMASIFPIKSDDGKTTHYIALKQDITERKILMEELIAAKEKAEESDRLKSAFLANMSHEIRTPLNGILGFSKLLSKSSLSNEKRNKYATIVKKNSDGLLHIVSDILDISKIESGQLEIWNSKVDINKTINDLYLLYKNRSGEKVKIKHEIYETDVHIYTDEYRLRQIFINLLDNALKFTEYGYVKFGITKLTGEWVFLYVEDTGIGIPLEFQKNIFQRFRQLEGTGSSQTGNGLGLAIVKQLIELMQGNIQVRSTFNEGTTFIFQLPLTHGQKKKVLKN